MRADICKLRKVPEYNFSYAWRSTLHILIQKTFSYFIFLHYVTVAFLKLHGDLLRRRIIIMWKFSTLFFKKFSAQSFKPSSCCVDSDSTKRFNSKVFSCFPYHIWHVNKLNFKYFFFRLSFLLKQIYKIFTEQFLASAYNHKATVSRRCDFRLPQMSCKTLLTLARFKEKQKRECNKNKTSNELSYTSSRLPMMLSIDRVNED